MDIPYTFEGSVVRKDGREALSREEIRDFLLLAVRHKLRRRLQFRQFVQDIFEKGRGAYSWGFLRWDPSADFYQTSLAVEPCGDGHYRLTCSNDYPHGPLFVLDRIKNLLRQREAGVRDQRNRRPKDARHERKLRRKRKSYIPKPAAAPTQVRKAKKARRVPAPLSLARNEKISPQFRHQRFFWREAAAAVVAIFEIKDGDKRTALQKAARALHDSFEQNGGAFAQFKRRGFALRFDLVDGIWRGDITPLSIAATKDNAHPLYRRMRMYFREKLGSLSTLERRARHETYAQAIKSNAVRFGGTRYAA